MNPYLLQWIVEGERRELEREARLHLMLRERIRAGRRRRLGVQLGGLTMVWLPLPGWLRLCIPAVEDQVSRCY